MRNRPFDSAAVVRVELKRADAAELVKQDALLCSADVIQAMGDRADEVLGKGVVRRYADRVIVFQKGEEGDSLFLVLAGEVRLIARKGSDSVEIETVNKGGILGEGEALKGAVVRGASALANGAVDLVELPREALLVGGRMPPLLRGALEGVHRSRQKTLDEMTDFLNRW